MNRRIFFKDTSAMGSLLVLGPIPQASRTAARQVSIGGRRAHLIFDGTLGRFPRFKICAAHGGGYLPSYADRFDYGCATFPEQCNTD